MPLFFWRVPRALIPVITFSTNKERLRQTMRLPLPGSDLRPISMRCTGLLALVLYGCVSLLLPVQLTRAQRGSINPGAMTIGCKKASCCTSRCYLDENGVHHCVRGGCESCECGLSPGDKSAVPSWTLDLATLESPDSLIPDLPSSLRTSDLPELISEIFLSVPVPPPW